MTPSPSKMSETWAAKYLEKYPAKTRVQAEQYWVESCVFKRLWEAEEIRFAAEKAAKDAKA